MYFSKISFEEQSKLMSKTLHKRGFPNTGVQIIDGSWYVNVIAVGWRKVSDLLQYKFTDKVGISL